VAESNESSPCTSFYWVVNSHKGCGIRICISACVPVEAVLNNCEICIIDAEGLVGIFPGSHEKEEDKQTSRDS
jgi:hypothetical protein